MGMGMPRMNMGMNSCFEVSDFLNSIMKGHENINSQLTGLENKSSDIPFWT